MKINVKKSGLWAFFGIHVRYVEKGEQEMKDDEAQHMIDEGGAELIKTVEAPEKAKEVVEPQKDKKKRGKNK